jgi:dTDP-4-dehydrorhamnose reductase
MKIYIAGAGGMLGEAFYKVFNESNTLKCTDIDINEPWLGHLDFRNFEDYRNQVKDFEPDWLFHLGAHTSLEYCEVNQVDAYQTNTKSVEYAVSIANSLDIPILYISTAGIFNGEKSFYDENDVPDPIGHYAKSKYLAEQYVIKNARKYLICRAGWMMGGGEKKDKKFVQKIIAQISSGKKEINVVNDKLGTPTYTFDFANNVKLLIDKSQTGLFNMVCKGFTDRAEVAVEILKLIKMESVVKIKLVDSSFFSDTYFAERPPCERLVNFRLDSINLNIMRDWRISLADYIRDEYSYFITSD